MTDMHAAVGSLAHRLAFVFVVLGVASIGVCGAVMSGIVRVGFEAAGYLFGLAFWVGSSSATIGLICAMGAQYTRRKAGKQSWSFTITGALLVLAFVVMFVVVN
jgi:hypothetical protein